MATTTKTYDDAGNVTVVDGPLSGTDDAIGYRYDANREIVGIIGPDPDGSGPRRRAAERFTYDAKGRVTQTEIGSVADLSDAGWNGFSTQQQVVATFDGVDRPLSRSVAASGTTYASTNYGYDHQRLDTVTIAMQGQGADRTTKYGYDYADRPTKVTSAYGTADQSDDVTVSYSPNGKVASATDANGNVTSYGYDGLDRITSVAYSGGSSDQAIYDANGNVTRRQLRDGQSIGYTYDALGRLISKDRPNTAYWETDQSFAYDLFGRLTTASDSNGRTLGFAYDALSRETSTSDNWYTFGNASSQYDIAGRRTRYTWADGFYVSYDYDAAGNMTAVRENGGTALVTFGYDDLGRRTSLGRANGTSTSYGYDPISRLAALTLAGGNQPNSITFAYNPASQIISRSASNDAYAWTASVNADRSYAVNALNQYTSAGGTTFSYDPRGNLTISGGSSYGYTSDNQLATAPGASLAYDPLGRLFNGVLDPGVNTTLVYDGANVMTELDQNNPGGLLRRYVYGPGADEALIWYEGTGTSDRRYLAADERGSIVSVTNDAGNAIAVNRYDEFGIPQAGNIGRIQYTGQKWLPSLGLYDYKARIYSPTLGRFMQTDPIGYADGMNWYNYVHGDPMNYGDSKGQACVVNGEEVGSLADQGLDAAGCGQIGGAYTPDPEIVVGGGGGGGAGNSDGGGFIWNGGGSVLGNPGVLGGLGGGGRLAVAQQNITSRIKNFLCGAPQPAGGGGVDAYAGVGVSILGAVSINPRNGQISFGFDLGVGVGLGGGGRYSVGKAFGVGSPSADAAPIASAGVNLNATGVAGPVGATGSYQLIGSNPGDWSAAYTGGAEISGNANISAHAQFNLPALYSLGCPK